MISKTKLLDSLKDLPETFTIEEVMDRLLLLQKIEQGLEESKAGKTISMEEAEKRVKKWS